MIVVLGDFDIQTKWWYLQGKTIYDSTRTNGNPPQFGLEQLIHESNYIIGEMSSCVDLIFASQPNLIVESGVQSFLHQNCHHQIVLASWNFKEVYPPRYEHDVWHFQKANFDHISMAISAINIQFYSK